MNDLRRELIGIAMPSELPRLLELAVEQERYEDAAVIRDEIAGRKTRKEAQGCVYCGKQGCRTLHGTVMIR